MASWLDDAEAVIEVISRKWAVPVLGALADGPRRHNELLRAVGCGIHPTVLDGTLRHLEQAGLVRREASTGTPLASWYQLTDLSRSLMDRIACLAQWADEQRPMLAALPAWTIQWQIYNDLASPGSLSNGLEPRTRGAGRPPHGSHGASSMHIPGSYRS